MSHLIVVPPGDIFIVSRIWSLTLCKACYWITFEPPRGKTNKMTVRPAKTQPSLIRVFSCAQWVAKDPSFLHADSEDSDQTGLVLVFTGRTRHFVGFVMRRLIWCCKHVSYMSFWRRASWQNLIVRKHFEIRFSCFCTNVSNTILRRTPDIIGHYKFWPWKPTVYLPEWHP